jgi:hypothetical protein
MMSDEKLDLILAVFTDIRNKMNEFGAETNLKNEFRGFRVELNLLESKLLIREAEEIQYHLEVKNLEKRIAKLEEELAA